MLPNSNAIESGGYNIDRSLRFRKSASAYLNRTNVASPTNNSKWTLSFWIKRGSNIGSGTYQSIFGAYNGNASIYTYCYFDTNDKFYLSYSNVGTAIQSNNTFRDPAAWYHIVIQWDITPNKIRAYVNGVEMSYAAQAAAGTYISSFNYASVSQALMAQYNGAGQYLDCYLAEVNFIDGQALTPSSFGQTDPVTGVWQPKKYTGTYGTNGFYLPFSDNTSATTLAYDKSGNGNNWTPNNISTTAGATYDSMTDVPTLTSTTAANYCVLNPLANGANQVLSNANLTCTNANASWRFTTATLGVSSGKWYYEAYVSNAWSYGIIGIVSASRNPYVDTSYFTNYTNSYGYQTDGRYYNNTTASTGKTSTTNGAVLMFAFDLDAGKMWMGMNGSWWDSGSPSTGTNPIFSSMPADTYTPAVSVYGSSTGFGMNFGQRPFSYTPPTGFKALNTFNLPDPTIKKPNQYMDATTFTANGTTQTVTNAGGFQPDLVWTKDRSSASSHLLNDSVRGAANLLYSNLTNAEGSVPTFLTSFNSNGFSLGSSNYANGEAIVGWQWKESATAGFDIVTYTGTGVARTVSHSLGVAPSMMIIKGRNSSPLNWMVYHKNLTPSASGYCLFLDTTDASTVTSGAWNNTLPTSTVFTIGANNNVNQNTVNYVAYLFTEIAGFSKFGSYTGNGSNDGSFIHLGFRARWVLFKCVTTGSHWVVCDTARDPLNAVGLELAPNNSNAENGTVGGTGDYDILSNGIKMRSVVGNEYNVSGYQYIYAAFAENPFKYANAR